MLIRRKGNKLHLIRTIYDPARRRGRQELIDSSLVAANPVPSAELTAKLTPGEREELARFLQQLEADDTASRHALYGETLAHSLQIATEALRAGWRPRDPGKWVKRVRAELRALAGSLDRLQRESRPGTRHKPTRTTQPARRQRRAG